MQRKILNLLTLLALLFGLVATVRPQPVLADCVDGDGGDNILVCDAIPGGENGDNQLDGGLGDDTMTVTETGSVENVDGDGDPTGSSDDPGVGDGGADEITINGVVTDSVYGDYVEDGAGGNDIIIINGTVAEVVIGDDAISVTASGADLIGGNDNITISDTGSVGEFVAGDGNFAGCTGTDCGLRFYAGTDNIFVNGYVDSFVAGDGDGGDMDCNDGDCGIYSEGGADQITIGATGDTGPVLGEGSYFIVTDCNDCGIGAYGGDDLITVDGEVYGFKGDPAVAGDGIVAETDDCSDCDNGVFGGEDTIVINGSAYGNIYGDGLVNLVDNCVNCGAYTAGGDDQITINSEVYEVYVSGDGIYTTGDAYGGNDTITVNTFANTILLGDDIFSNDAQGGNDNFTVAVGAYVYGIEGDGIFADDYGLGGDDTITVNGDAFYVLGDGTTTSIESAGGPDVAGIDCATACGDSFLDGGNDTITVNGSVYYVNGDGGNGCMGDDTINVNGDVIGDLQGDSDFFDCESDIPYVSIAGPSDFTGDDTVNIGAGGVTYSQVCGDIDVTTVNRRQGTVGGYIDGDYYVNDGYDTLNFGLLTPNQGEADSLAAYLASLDPSGGTLEVNGQTYNYYNFEELNVNATIFTEGATRMYDDGVTLAFAIADGIQVCNGPSGLKAGLIDYGRLTAGQREFGANGFIVTLTDVGSNHFEVHVFKDGVEQFDDANNDGVADDLFVFGF